MYVKDCTISTVLCLHTKVFLIDDALSMVAHRDRVRRVLAVLAYLVKDSDPDGIEICFTGSSATEKARDSTKILRAFDQNRPKGFTDMNGRLGALLDGYTAQF